MYKKEERFINQHRKHAYTQPMHLVALDNANPWSVLSNSMTAKKKLPGFQHTALGAVKLKQYRGSKSMAVVVNVVSCLAS